MLPQMMQQQLPAPSSSMNISQEQSFTTQKEVQNKAINRSTIMSKINMNAMTDQYLNDKKITAQDQINYQQQQICFLQNTRKQMMNGKSLNQRGQKYNQMLKTSLSNMNQINLYRDSSRLENLKKELLLQQSAQFSQSQTRLLQYHEYLFGSGVLNGMSNPDSMRYFQNLNQTSQKSNKLSHILRDQLEKNNTSQTHDVEVGHIKKQTSNDKFIDQSQDIIGTEARAEFQIKETTNANQNINEVEIDASNILQKQYRQIEKKDNMDSLESSEFYPNQEVLMTSKPVFEQDQISLQISNNNLQSPKNEIKQMNNAVDKTSQNNSQKKIDRKASARSPQDPNMTNFNSTLTKANQAEKNQKEQFNGSYENSIENRVKRDLLKTSEGMKTNYQLDTVEMKKEIGITSHIIQSPQQQNGSPALQGTGNQAQLPLANTEESIQHLAFPNSSQMKQILSKGQGPQQIRPYEALIYSGQVPNPILPYMNSFTKTHLEVANNLKGQLGHPCSQSPLSKNHSSKNTLLAATPYPNIPPAPFSPLISQSLKDLHHLSGQKQQDGIGLSQGCIQVMSPGKPVGVAGKGLGQNAPVLGQSVDTRTSKEYLLQQRQVANGTDMQFKFGSEVIKENLHHKGPTKSQGLNNVASQAKFKGPTIINFGFRQSGIEDTGGAFDVNFSKKQLMDFLDVENNTPSGKKRQLNQVQNNWSMSAIPYTQSLQQLQKDYSVHSGLDYVAQVSQQIVDPKNVGMTQPTAKEKLTQIDVSSIKLSEPETILINSVEVSQDQKTPELKEPHKLNKFILNSKEKLERSRNVRGGSVEQLISKVDSFPQQSQSLSNVIVFSKIPPANFNSYQQNIQAYNYPGIMPDFQSNLQIPQSGFQNQNIFGSSFRHSRYPPSISTTNKAILTGDTEQFLQQELVNTFDKIKVSREQISELKKLARLRRHQRNKTDLPTHDFEIQKVKQYSQVYLDSLQQCDDYTFGIAGNQANSQKSKVQKHKYSSQQTSPSDLSLQLEKEADKFRYNFDIFAELFKNQANLLHPSSYNRQGCKQLIFIPSGLPQVSSMASIKNTKTNHSIFHSSNKISQRKNQEIFNRLNRRSINIQEKNDLRNSNRSSSIPSDQLNKKRKQVSSSLPPLTNKGVQSPYKGSLIGNTSKKSMQDITEQMVIERESQNEIQGFNDMNKTQTILEISMRNSQMSNKTNRSSSIVKDRAESTQDQLQLPKLIRVQQNLDNSVQVSRINSSLNILKQQPQTYKQDSRFKLLQYKQPQGQDIHQVDQMIDKPSQKQHNSTKTSPTQTMLSHLHLAAHNKKHSIHGPSPDNPIGGTQVPPKVGPDSWINSLRNKRISQSKELKVGDKEGRNSMLRVDQADRLNLSTQQVVSSAKNLQLPQLDQVDQKKIDAIKQAFLLNIKHNPNYQNRTRKQQESAISKLKNVQNQQSLIAIQQTNDIGMPANTVSKQYLSQSCGNRSRLNNSQVELKPSQLAKLLLKESKNRSRRKNQNILSVQSIGYNPYRTQIEDIMQERLEISIGVMERVNDLHMSIKNKKLNTDSSQSSVSEHNKDNLNISFDQFLANSTQQKDGKNVSIEKYEQYLLAMNDHSKRMGSFIDSKIKIENRKRSAMNLDTDIASVNGRRRQTATTFCNILSQPQSNQVTPRELQRRSNADKVLNNIKSQNSFNNYKNASDVCQQIDRKESGFGINLRGSIKEDGHVDELLQNKDMDSGAKNDNFPATKTKSETHQSPKASDKQMQRSQLFTKKTYDKNQDLASLQSPKKTNMDLETLQEQASGTFNYNFKNVNSNSKLKSPLNSTNFKVDHPHITKQNITFPVNYQIQEEQLTGPQSSSHMSKVPRRVFEMAERDKLKAIQKLRQQSDKFKINHSVINSVGSGQDIKGSIK